MRTHAHGAWNVAVSVALAVFIGASASAQKADRNDKSKDAKAAGDRPKLTLAARPSIAIAPARVVLTAELNGGANDFEDYYCPTVRWEWGDLSSSESGMDCPPYEAGKSEIKRRFTVEHTFDHAGSYKVYFRLKHGSKELVATSITVKLQPGTNDNDQ